MEMKHPDLALPDLDLAIKLDPGFAVAFANRAFAWTMLKDDSKANRDLESAVRLGMDRALLTEKLAEYQERTR
jgi:Tfp pilus assembly protein PilF